MSLIPPNGREFCSFALDLKFGFKHLIRETLRILAASGLSELVSLEVVSDSSEEPMFLPEEISSLPRLEQLKLSDVGASKVALIDGA